MVACKMHNSIPPGTWWHRVETVGSKKHLFPVGEYPNLTESFLPVICNHCENPPCTRVCPVGATWKDPNGIVQVDYERCIGCRYCMTACPYGVRQFNWQQPEKNYEKAYELAGVQDASEVLGDVHGYPLEHRTGGGRLVYTPKRPKGVVEKCTFCVQYVEQGLAPACVRSCTGNARIFGDLSDPGSRISRVVASNGVFRLLEDYATHPKVFYIPADNKKGKGEVIYDAQV
jgi:molybdopterin-containing oxidoreductase family iron-sulfur binding subunit